MYNKLFTKILDSSIWLESITTRIVWLTMIAAMDEQGFVQFASVPNLALRARVPLSACEKAVVCLESPDDKSADPDHEGRRIERVPGGWMVLNAAKYRDLVTRAVVQAQTRERVARHRARKGSNAPVTYHIVTPQGCNAPVTPSEADTESKAHVQKRVRVVEPPRPPEKGTDETVAMRAGIFVQETYPALYAKYRKGARYAGREHLDYQEALTLCRTWDDERLAKIATVFLTTDHEFAEKGSRTMAQFRSLASWCDSRLRENGL